MPHTVTSRDKIHPVGPALITLYLLRGRRMGGYWFQWRRTRLEFVNGALLTGTSPALNEKLRAVIWRMALGRVSSRPVDMVLSIMQVLGVTLDPKGFHADDRIGATIALAQGLMKLYDGQPIWLRGIFDLPPSPQYSIFSRDFNEAERKEPPILDSSAGDPESELLPTGTLDDEGYFTFVPEQVYPITRVEGTAPDTPDTTVLRIQAEDGTHWDVHRTRSPGQIPDTSMLAVKIITIWDSRDHSNYNFGYFIVQAHAPGKYHRIAQFWNKRLMKEDALTRSMEWGKDRTISIGGPVPHKKHT